MSKPQRVLDSLGPHVEITNKRVQDDGMSNFKKRLRDLGKALKVRTEDFVEYSGSFATHVYTNKAKSEIRLIHQHVMDKPISERVIHTAVSDLALHLMQVIFNRKKPATRDPKDLRGKK
jgi:hypothetical protein